MGAAYPLAVVTSPPIRDERTGLLFAAGAAILYGAAYPATGIALRSFTPLGIAALACTIALPVVVVAAALGVIPRPTRAAWNGPSVLRLLVLAMLGGLGFIAAVNIAVSLSGSTVTGFIAPLYAVAAALFAIPILGERVRPAAIAGFVLAIAGTALLAGFDAHGTNLGGIAMGLAAAVMFGLYIVLARRWGRRYALDGTLITIANLATRGPLLLAHRMAARARHADPGQPGSGGGRRPPDDRIRGQLDRQPPADGERPTRAGGSHVGRPAPDADLVGDHRGRGPGRAPHPHRALRGGADPRRDRGCRRDVRPHRRDAARLRGRRGGRGGAERRVIRRAWFALTAGPTYPATHADRATFDLVGLRLPIRATVAIAVVTFILLFDYSHTFLPADVMALGRSPEGARALAIERLLLFGLAPLLVVVLGFRDRPSRYGLTLGDWRWGAVLTAVGCLVMTPIVVWFARQPDVQAYYAVSAGSTADVVITNAIELTAVEFAFRGFLMLTLVRAIGPLGVVVATFPFVFGHLGKPELELFSTLLGGLAYGWLAWRTRSIVWGSIGHTWILSLLILASTP